MTASDDRSPLDTWIRVLDCLEASLEYHEHTVREARNRRTIDSRDPWPPGDLPVGPVPSLLSDRAQALHQRSLALLDDVAREMTDLKPPRRLRGSSRPTADHPRVSYAL